ncbi:MAG: stage III sporulation protein AC [Clostridia bacterium]|nr:stage III sporulation protein AC [Clostridia bacterium]
MEIEIIFKIAAIGLIVAVLNQILQRSGRDEYTMITTIAGLILALMMILPYISTLFTYIKSVFDL